MATTNMKPGRKGYKILFDTNTIIMNYKFAAAAAIYGTAENKLMKDIRTDFPGMDEVVVSGRVQTTAKANHRLTYENMEKHIRVYENADELLAVFETVKAASVALASPYYNHVKGVQDCSRGNTYHNRKFRDAATAHGLIVDHHEKYGWTITSPSDDLLEFILKNDLTDILINRNEFSGFQITGTGTHNGVPTFVGVAPRKSSSRKYACPCCGMSVRATKVVNIACMDCDEQLLLVG